MTSGPPDDLDFWRRALAGVEPLKRKRRRPHATPAFVPNHGQNAPRTLQQKNLRPRWTTLDYTAPPLRATNALAPEAALPALDARSKKHIRKGRLPIDATLDLHGLREAEAHRAVVRFLESAQAQGAKTVLIITGKGKPGMPGVLRKNLLHWLAAEQALKKQIQSVSESAPNHGGEGAFYVMLRRKK